ncbi:MAG: class I SAM-dependent methyltransferase [Clostridium sp.]|uniref:class I SAM-dependent methyltransferase n=1 Tax=Clostridium sp. TaxID=1506 RepID=UPI002FCC81C9
MDTSQKKYSNEWNESSNFFYENNSYSWMANQIKEYNIILEIGCGTGQSTLSLLESGHKVIAIEKNIFCIDKAKLLLESKGYKVGSLKDRLENYDVIILNKELFDTSLSSYLKESSFDAVICWNVGTYWDDEMVQYYRPIMYDYGLSVEQIASNMKCYYGEIIISMACKIAYYKKVPVNIIDRIDQKLTEENDTYFVTIKKEFDFSNIKYENIRTQTLSTGGKALEVKGNVFEDELIEVYLTSILMNY